MCSSAVLRGVSGSVTVVAPPGQQTTIETTRTTDGKSETTSQVVTGSAQLTLGENGPVAGATPVPAPQPAMSIAQGSTSSTSVGVKVVATTAKPPVAMGIAGN